MGIMENKMETTGTIGNVNIWCYIGTIQGLHWGDIGKMDKKKWNPLYSRVISG